MARGTIIEPRTTNFTLIPHTVFYHVTRLHLIRHGQTDWNLERRIQGQTDSQLTDLGRRQAQDIGSHLKAIPFSAAYASSSIRARDTAQVILQYHQQALRLRDDLREIFLGDWEGRLYADVQQQQPEAMGYFLEDPSLFALAGAESFFQVQERALNAVNEIIDQHRGQEILLVSHGVWIKTVLTAVEGRNMQDFWQPPKMANCCHSIIEFENGVANPALSAKIIRYAGFDEW